MLRPIKDLMRWRLALILVVFLAGCRTASTLECGVRESERPIVSRALDIYSKGKVSREHLLRDVDPVVVYLPNMTCVGLNLKPGHAGGDETMCFDRDGRQVLYYRNGD